MRLTVGLLVYWCVCLCMKLKKQRMDYDQIFGVNSLSAVEK